MIEVMENEIMSFIVVEVKEPYYNDDTNCIEWLYGTDCHQWKWSLSNAEFSSYKEYYKGHQWLSSASTDVVTLFADNALSLSRHHLRSLFRKIGLSMKWNRTQFMLEFKDSLNRLK